MPSGNGDRAEERSPRSTLHGFADAMRKQGWIDVALLQDMATQELVDCIVAALPFVQGVAEDGTLTSVGGEARHVLAKMRAAVGR